MKKNTNKLLAEWLGWELLYVAHYDTEEETPRLTELEPWLDRNGIEHVGDYYIVEKDNWFMSAEDWNPLESHDQIHKYLYPKVLERGLKLKFLDELSKTSIAPGSVGWVWDMTTASAPDICQAIIKVAGLEG